MPAVLMAGLLSPRASAAAAAGPQQNCILGIICLPGPPGPAPSPSPSPTTGLPGLPGLPLPPLPAPGLPGPGPLPGPAPSPSPGADKPTAATPGLEAAAATSVITAGSAALGDFAYQGVATVPTARGSQPMMKFTAASLTLSGGVTATVTQSGVSTITTSSALGFAGSVVLYATQLSGCLGAVCVTLRPGNVVTVLLQLLGPATSHASLTLTSVTTDQPLVTAGSLQAGGLRISLR
jgi:hypothetical protein